MKVFISFLLLVLMHQASMAQTTPRNAIKFNPLSLIFRTANFAYERATTRNQSAQLGLMYSSLRTNSHQYTGFSITPSYRFYIGAGKEALNGIYVAPFGKYQQFKISKRSTDKEASFTSTGGGLLLGYEKAFSSGLLLELFVGPSFSKASFKEKDSEDDFSLKRQFEGVGIKSGISVGFAF